jgi:hypothetical protein
MKVLIVSAIAVAVLLAGATGILRSRLPSAHDEMAAMPPMQQLQSGASVDKLPADDFEDRSLVYPREPKR